MAVANKNRRRTADVLRLSVVMLLTKDGSAPAETSFARSSVPFPETGGEEGTPLPCRHAFTEASCPSALSFVYTWPAPPVTTTHGPATALQRVRRTPVRCPTQATLPKCGVSTTWPTSQAPAITPAAALHPRLVAIVATLVTSLDQIAVSAGLPPCHTFRSPEASDFSVRKQKLRLPFGEGLSIAVRHRLQHGLPTRALRPFHS